MDIMMRHNDTHHVAAHLHLLPKDLSMVHPDVNGAAMRHGHYATDGNCKLSDGFGYDRAGNTQGSVDCGRQNRYLDCIYCSLRDLNSCDPTTDNIVNGMSIDVYALPRTATAECTDPTTWAKLQAEALKEDAVGYFHGWRLPISRLYHSMLTESRNFNGWKGYMLPTPRSAEIHSSVDTEKTCENYLRVKHPQPMECAGARPGMHCTRKD